MDMSQIREQIEDDILYLLHNKIIKLKEVPGYVHYLYMKWNGFDENMISFADKCYEEMIVLSIKTRRRKRKPEHNRIVQDFLDYKNKL